MLFNGESSRRLPMRIQGAARRKLMRLHQARTNTKTRWWPRRNGGGNKKTARDSSFRKSVFEGAAEPDRERF